MKKALKGNIEGGLKSGAATNLFENYFLHELLWGAF